MGKILDKAIRIGNEKTWEEFARNHPEILVFFYKGKVVDVEKFSKQIDYFTIHYVNGFVDSILYEYNGELYNFPTKQNV